MKPWPYRLLFVLLYLTVSFAITSDVQAQARSNYSHVSTEANVTNDSQGAHASEHWKESPEETDFSVFHHHVAGFFILAFGLVELGHALQYPLPFWTRFVLPGALTLVGGFVLLGNDHGAWPIGMQNFDDLFGSPDQELIEHKLYGVLALVIAFFEFVRRSGRSRQPVWAAPLVLLTLAGSLWLFVHSHGDHPAIAKIQFQHSLLGIVGTGAALSKGLASWRPSASPYVANRWEVAWAGSEILFGLLLLVYSQ
ncbi:MAG: hypothetical protein AB7P24_07180 [Nitrospira sp.]